MQGLKKALHVKSVAINKCLSTLLMGLLSWGVWAQPSVSAQLVGADALDSVTRVKQQLEQVQKQVRERRADLLLATVTVRALADGYAVQGARIGVGAPNVLGYALAPLAHGEPADEERFLNYALTDKDLNCQIVVTVDAKGHSQISALNWKTPWSKAQQRALEKLSQKVHDKVLTAVFLHELAHCQLYDPSIQSGWDAFAQQNKTQGAFAQYVQGSMLLRTDPLGAWFKEVHAEAQMLAWMQALYGSDKDAKAAVHWVGAWRKMRAQEVTPAALQALDFVHACWHQDSTYATRPIDLKKCVPSKEQKEQALTGAQVMNHSLGWGYDWLMQYAPRHTQIDAQRWQTQCQSLALYVIDQHQKPQGAAYFSWDDAGSKRLDSYVYQWEQRVGASKLNALHKALKNVYALEPLPYKNAQAVDARLAVREQLSAALCELPDQMD